MSKKDDLLYYIAKTINDEQVEHAELLMKLDCISNTNAGKEAINLLKAIYETKRQMLDKIYKDIQAM